MKKKGIERIDVVIANAAVNLGCGTGFKDIDVDLQEETFRINVSLSLSSLSSLSSSSSVSLLTDLQSLAHLQSLADGKHKN